MTDIKTEKTHLTVFGYGLAFILGIIAVKIWFDSGWRTIHAVLSAGIITLILATSLRHDLLKPVYTRWMRIVHLIGNVLTALILSILFYFVFGISGIILRLLKKDLLDQRIDRTANSYWIQKDRIHFDKTHYVRQF
jgi:hypothetical protein